MIVTFLLSVILAQTAPSSAPAATPSASVSAPAAPAGWTSQPSGKPEDIFRYVRIESDGSKSTISQARQVCDCRPDHMMELLAQALSQIPNVAITRDAATVCGVAAQHMLVTGIADRNRSNFEVYALRKNGALYVYDYTFQEKAPDPQAESTLLSRCP